MRRVRTSFGRWKAAARAEADDTDAGFTLVELAASITVLAVGIVGVIGVMNGSMRVAVETSARSRAIAVATKHIEGFRAMDYDDLPVSGPTDEIHAEPDTVDGRTFMVTKAVTQVDEATEPEDDRDAQPAAYRKAVVSVEWVESGTYHEVHQETLLYPGGRGKFSPITVSAPVGNGRPLAPSNLVAIVPTDLVGTTGVDLAWTPPVGSNPPVVSYVVQYSTDSSFSTYHEVTANLPAETPALRVANLAAETIYHFRVATVAENGNLSTSWATTYNVQTLASASTVCTIGTATVTPSAVRKKNGSESSVLNSDLQVSINGLGTCSTTSLTMTYSPVDGDVDTVPLTRSGSRFMGTVDGDGQPWSVGEHAIDVHDADGDLRATMQVTVCEKNKLVCP